MSTDVFVFLSSLHNRQMLQSIQCVQLGHLASCCCSLTKSCPTLCDPHGLSPTRLPCPPPSPRVCANSCPLSRWCFLIISSSATPFSFLFINPEHSLVRLFLKLKLQYFSHLMRRTNSLEKMLMPGKIEGRWRRGHLVTARLSRSVVSDSL